MIAIAINNKAARVVDLRVPQVGAWVADVALDNDDPIGGSRATITVGTATFKGTIDESLSGTFGTRRTVRVVAGAFGWQKTVTAQHWHNDAGVKDTLVLSSTAAAVGETLVGPATATRIGLDFVRAPGPARRVLERIAPAWHVDYAGMTQVVRVAHTPGAFDLLTFDPANNMAELAVDEVTAVQVGDVLTTRLDKPLTVRQLQIKATAEGLRVLVWGTTP